MGELERLLVAHIEAHGPIGFDEFQDHALYAPGLGFYTRGRGAGRRRDFLTSPEVGPLFGAVLARALDSWWEELGRPDPYLVVEAGAGPGTLARSILASEPACRGALALTLVEVGEPQWASHPTGVTSRVDLPAPGELGTGPVVVVANELLDNLPVAIAERAPDGWVEVVVSSAQGQLVERLRPLAANQVEWCELRAPDAPVGGRVPVQAAAAAWLGEALDLARGGRVVVFDYARSTAEMAALPPASWLRTYAGHGRSSEPLVDPGHRDITCDVAVDQLVSVAVPTLDSTQAAFLRSHGIDDLVGEGRRRWEDQGAAGGLHAVAGLSRVREAEALLDPDGLGGFRVLQWATPS